VASAPAAWAGQPQPGLSVNGRASQEFAPDQGKLVVGVVTLAATSAEAARQNATLMDRVSAAVKAKLTPQDQLKSVGYHLYSKTEWDSVSRRTRRAGYEASNRLEITSGDPQTLGAILDAAVNAGANSVAGPAWSLADPAAARRQVQALALADARAQAEALAQAAGLQLGNIIAMEVDGAGPPHLAPAPMRAMAPGAPPSPETSLEPGVIAVQATVRCLFAIAPKP
jgi:uncharacterized protein YggE